LILLKKLISVVKCTEFGKKVEHTYVCDVYDIANKNEMFYFILPHPVVFTK